VVWHATSPTTRGKAGPAAGPLGTPTNEATSTHTGLDDYYDNYDYEPPARRPRLRCLCALARYDSEPRQALGAAPAGPDDHYDGDHYDTYSVPTAPLPVCSGPR
jgi:hypothetical protein